MPDEVPAVIDDTAEVVIPAGPSDRSGSDPAPFEHPVVALSEEPKPTAVARGFGDPA